MDNLETFSLEDKSAYTEKLIASGELTVKLSPPFDNGERKKRILETIALGPWAIPEQGKGNTIFARGTSIHEVQKPGQFSSTSLILPFEQEIDIVIKPAGSVQKAKTELMNLERIGERGGVRICRPVGITIERRDGEENAFLITCLEKGVVPFENLRIENLREEDQKAILRDLAKAICEMHNLGIVHGDLHLSNVAYDPEDIVVEKESGVKYPRVIFFDFEKAQVFPKKRFLNAEEYPRKLCRLEEGMMRDLAKAYVNLTDFLCHLQPDFVDKFLIEAYMAVRSEIRQELYPAEKFREQLIKQIEETKRIDRGKFNFFHPGKQV